MFNQAARFTVLAFLVYRLQYEQTLAHLMCGSKCLEVSNVNDDHQ